MTRQVSYVHLLSCCLKIHSHRSKERGQLAKGHNSFPLESQLPDEKDIPQTSQRCYQSKTPPFCISDLQCTDYLHQDRRRP